MLRGSLRRVPGMSVAALAVAFLVGACGSDVPPVAVRSESAAAAATAEASPEAEAETPEPTRPTAPPTPTSAAAEATPAPTARPAATVAPPTPTRAPAVTVTPVVVLPTPPAIPPQPTATPTPSGAAGPLVGCSVEPQGQVKVGDPVQFTATTSRTDLLAISFVFDHGDGTSATGPVSTVRYQSAGYYRVRLSWSDIGGSGTVDCAMVVVGPAFNAGDYIGKPRAVAEQLAVQNGFTVRITRVDGESFPGTADFRLDRLNLEIDAGIVTNASPG